jgi:hypothetical protein
MLLSSFLSLASLATIGAGQQIIYGQCGGIGKFSFLVRQPLQNGVLIMVDRLDRTYNVCFRDILSIL